MMATEGRKEGLVEVREGGREERRVGGRKTVWPGPSAHSGALDSPRAPASVCGSAFPHLLEELRSVPGSRSVHFCFILHSACGHQALSGVLTLPVCFG